MVNIRDNFTEKLKVEVKSGSQKTDNTKASKKTPDYLTICSFRINDLGYTKNKDNGALAYVLKAYDIVIIQGLVAPPFPMDFPDGRPVKPVRAATDFFNAMLTHGFEYELSPEDTGHRSSIHSNDSSTEWWVAFYNDQKITVANNLPRGYLAGDRSNHADYERVPYAFSFRTVDKKLDFVAISVNLKDGDSHTERRKNELASVAQMDQFS